MNFNERFDIMMDHGETIVEDETRRWKNLPETERWIRLKTAMEQFEKVHVDTAMSFAHFVEKDVPAYVVVGYDEVGREIRQYIHPSTITERGNEMTDVLPVDLDHMKRLRFLVETLTDFAQWNMGRDDVEEGAIAASMILRLTQIGALIDVNTDIHEKEKSISYYNVKYLCDKGFEDEKILHSAIGKLQELMQTDEVSWSFCKKIWMGIVERLYRLVVLENVNPFQSEAFSAEVYQDMI